MIETNPDNWFTRYYAELERQKASLPGRKELLLDTLHAARIARVTVSYDGEGDSGQLECVDAVALDGSAIDLATLSVPEPQMAGDDTSRHPHLPLSQLVEDFVWAVLNAHHDGFEINDGGYGELTIDVTARSVTLQRYDRVVHADSSQIEF